MRAFLNSCFALLFMSSLNVAQAAIIEGNFSGKVLRVTEKADVSPAYVDFFGPDTLNSTFSGSFRYDTDLMPRNFAPELAWFDQEYKGGYYSHELETKPTWLDIRFNVNGKILEPNKIPNGSEVNNVHNLANIGSEFIVVGPQPTESLGLAVHSTHETKSPSSIYQSIMISFDESLDNLINKDSLEQEFNWLDRKTYVYSEQTPPRGWAIYHLVGLNWYSNLQMQITEISVRTQVSSTVPEPASISLMLLVLVLIVRLKSKQLEWRQDKSMNTHTLKNQVFARPCE